VILNSRKIIISSLVLLFSQIQFGLSKERSPLPDTAYDGGIISAETLGRGGTIASNRGTPGSGSENPASLSSGFPNSLYTTIFLNSKSSLNDQILKENEPLQQKQMQYLSLGADKGVLFFEPLGRRQLREILNPSSPSNNFRDVEFEANAIGFAGANEWNGGSLGISLAYVWSSLFLDEQVNSTRVISHDTGNGVRMNIGLRYPTGPAMWGLVVQNAPGFVWGKDYRRDQLPLKIRVGNTYRLKEGVLFSIDAERRFYREGGEQKNYVYLGNESFLSKKFVVRVGAFGHDVSKSEERHLTAGFTYIESSNFALSYAFDTFEISNEKVKNSSLSIVFPIDVKEK
jgi:hypothetical protein